MRLVKGATRKTVNVSLPVFRPVHPKRVMITPIWPKSGTKPGFSRRSDYSSNGDQAGSEAKEGVSIRRSFRPERSIE